MQKIILFCLLFLTAALLTAASAEKPRAPFRIGVLDFTSIDVEGHKRFLDDQKQVISIPPSSTLNSEDRQSINAVMQGFVRMIDAWNTGKNMEPVRRVEMAEYHRQVQQQLALYRKTVDGESRPMIIGADYLRAALAQYPDIFGTIDPAPLHAALTKLAAEPDFPRAFPQRIAQLTGATHMIRGTVSDIRRQQMIYRGYGIETKTTVYQLDLLLQMIDLSTGSSVYGGTYTAEIRERQPLSGAIITDNHFQRLLNAAVQQAATAFAEACRSGRIPAPVQAAAPQNETTTSEK